MLRQAFWLLAWAFPIVQAVQLTIPESSLLGGVVAGSPFNISWLNADGPIGLLLRNGTTNTTVSVIAFDLRDTTSYLWTPATSLPNGQYTIEIGDTKALSYYSTLFNLSGGGLPATSQSTFYTSTISNAQSTMAFVRTRTGSWTHTGTAPHPTCTSSCSRPPPPPVCTASCMRNLNDTRVTHTASIEVASSTSTTNSSKTMIISTKDKGLSDSAKVAIGVGAAVASSIILILAVLTFWHGRRARRDSVKDTNERYMMHGACGGEKYSPPVELDAGVAHNILEIDGRRQDTRNKENG